jgi:hypothetical protein
VSSTRAFPQSQVLTSILPTDGVVGMQVQINGTGFGEVQGSSTILLNGTAAIATSWSDTRIVVIVPSGAISGPFSATVGGQIAYSSSFTVAALPSGWLDADVGAVGTPGNSTYAGVFTVNGAGSQIYGVTDAFHFVYQPLPGDGSIVARVVSMPNDAMAGVMIRETLDSGSANGNVVDYVPYGALWSSMCGRLREETLRNQMWWAGDVPTGYGWCEAGAR